MDFVVYLIAKTFLPPLSRAGLEVVDVLKATATTLLGEETVSKGIDIGSIWVRTNEMSLLHRLT